MLTCSEVPHVLDCGHLIVTTTNSQCKQQLSVALSHEYAGLCQHFGEVTEPRAVTHLDSPSRFQMIVPKPQFMV